MTTSQTELPTVLEVAEQAQLSVVTLRRYIKIGVIEVFKDRRGWIRCEPNAVEKVRAHFLAHGAPGGRPIPQ